jgi:hypothetical protein
VATIQWHLPGDKVYENGLDRGVLYVEGENGVPWNGLTSLQESNTSSLVPVHFDGIKINDIVVLGAFSGRISAFTYPEEFLPCEGVVEDQLGVYLTEQPQKRFGISYRTLINNDLGVEAGYKLHIVYNLTAKPIERQRRTLGLNTDLMLFEWDITALPENIENHHPTAHLILDSRKLDPWLLTDIEEILYGTDTTEATLPDLIPLTTFIRKWDRLIIRDNGDGTWTAISQDDAVITWLDGPDNTEFQIIADNVVWLDGPTNTEYEISSSDKNEEDI